MSKSIPPKQGEYDVRDHDPDTSNPKAIVAEMIGTFMLVLLHFSPSKPADPAAWAALGKLDKCRRKLQREAGVEQTRIVDPHGRATYWPEQEGQ